MTKVSSIRIIIQVQRGHCGTKYYMQVVLYGRRAAVSAPATATLVTVRRREATQRPDPGSPDTAHRGDAAAGRVFTSPLRAEERIRQRFLLLGYWVGVCDLQTQ